MSKVYRGGQTIFINAVVFEQMTAYVNVLLSSIHHSFSGWMNGFPEIIWTTLVLFFSWAISNVHVLGYSARGSSA